MSTVMLYVVCLGVLAGAIAIWYLTKGSDRSLKILPWLVAIVVIVMLAVSCSNRIPFVSSVASWIRDKFADKKIEKLGEDIKRLEKERDEGTKSAQEYQAKAEKVLKDAKNSREALKAMDAVLDKKAGKLRNGRDTRTEAEAALPMKQGDALSEAVSLVKELQRRKIR